MSTSFSVTRVPPPCRPCITTRPNFAMIYQGANRHHELSLALYHYHVRQHHLQHLWGLSGSLPSPLKPTFLNRAVPGLGPASPSSPFPFRPFRSLPALLCVL